MKSLLQFSAAVALGLTLAFGAGCSKNGSGDVNVTAMIAELKKPDSAAQQDACIELAKAGPNAAPAVSALIPLLKDSNPDTRRLAAYTLMEIGPAAKAAIPAVKELLRDSDRQTALQAVNTMRAIDPSSADLPMTPNVSN